MGTESEEVRAAVAGEIRPLDPAVRLSRDLAEELLDPDFVEVGQPGRRWDREAMLDDLPTMPGTRDDQQIQVVGMRGVLLAPGLVYLTYESILCAQHHRPLPVGG